MSQDSLLLDSVDLGCGKETSKNPVYWHFEDSAITHLRGADFVSGGEVWVSQQRSNSDAMYEVCKRVMDVLISIAAIVLLFPIITLTAALIKTFDRGPILFSQIRVGQQGKQFRCFKFRSMIRNAESVQDMLQQENEHCDPRTFKIINDPRITPLGRILRRFSIDELPQILNVLTGHMSIVGPRPPL
ncbi:MAG: sugar transferase, partial [Planctomycetota bacterium]|nr:sugar transferase [Planctomycetota bacterium]